MKKIPIKKGQLYKRAQKRPDAIAWFAKIIGKGRAGKWRAICTNNESHSFKENTLRYYFTLITDS